jgi:hypothetical protein
VLFIDAVIYFIDAINPALDDCTRAQLLGIDLAALGIDAAALLLPGAPGGGGLGLRIFGQGARVLAQGGVQASVRVIQVGARGAQLGTHASAMTKGGGRGTRGAGGNSGSGPGGKQSPYDVIHTGGNTLPQKVADAYNTTKDKLHEALRQIKRENGLGNDYHHLKFLRNGEVWDSNTDVFYGNVKDYLH